MINDNHLTVNVLLDTGALGENDYMNTATADWLRANGVVLHDSGLTRVCGAFAGNSCQISSQTVKHALTFLNNDLNNDNKVDETYDFVFKVVHSIDYDIIIGRKTITDNNLWHWFPRNPDPQWTVVRPKKELPNQTSEEVSGENEEKRLVSRKIAKSRDASEQPPILGNNITELRSTHTDVPSMSTTVSPACNTQTSMAVRVRGTTFHPAQKTKR